MPRQEITLDYDDLERLRAEFGLSEVPQARFSGLFVSQLYLFQRFGRISVEAIVDTVRGLHGVDPPQQTKGPLQFTRPPLEGLWHVHFLDAKFIPENLCQQWRRRTNGDTWLTAAIDRTCAASGEEVFTPKLIQDIARVTVEDALADRAETSRLTGEWIIFAIHGDVHYYLTVAYHHEPDGAIHSRICRFASAEFPFLGLESAA